MKFIFLILVCYIVPAQASWLEVDKLFVDGKFYTGRSNDDLNSSIGRKLDKGLTLGLDINFLGFMFFDNRVEGRTGCIDDKQCQFSEVSYNFYLGASIFPWLDINYGHLSTHALDSKYDYGIEDSVGFRIYLINSSRRDSLFP